MTDVFISYARRTAAQAHAAADALRTCGYEVWIDEELPAHGSFADVITERIGEARAVLVIWSEDATRSEWVRSEASRARQGRKLVQVTLDSTPLPMPFDQLQCVRLMGWTGDPGAPAWAKVVASIAELVGRPPSEGSAWAKAVAPAAPVRARPAAQVRSEAAVLAVLPFDALTDDPETTALGEGVGDDVIHLLTGAPGLGLISRTAVLRFRGAAKAGAASALKATHILDGAVRRSGSRVRVTAHLTRADDDAVLWSERYDRALDDVFALQDELAERVAKAVGEVLAPPAGPRGGSDRPTPGVATGEAERRQVTVLASRFSPAVSSGAIDPEEWQVAAAAFLPSARSAAEALGGHIAHAQGDTLVVYFGYPEAREDAAERAVRAGLAMVRAARAANAERTGVDGVHVTVRIGIHTGAVVTGQSGAVEVFGDAPQIADAARSAAPADSVVMTSAVHHLVSGLFVVEEIDPGAGDVSPAPQRLYQAVAPTLTGRWVRGFASPETARFVGRGDELHLLMGRWTRARDGYGQLVLLMGEAGIGKSRLTEEFRARLRDEPHVWVECGGAPLFANTAFHPLTQMLAQALGWGGDETPQERLAMLEQSLARSGQTTAEPLLLVAELLGLPPSSGTAPLALGPHEKRMRLLAALAEWVFGAARAQPMVLLVEDLHWVDPSTLELIQILAEQGATASLLVLCTARPEFKVTWPMRSHHALVTLGRLSGGETREMVAAAVMAAKLSPDMVDAVIERTDGVPLFAEELTRLMLEAGGAVGGHEIPATLLDSLAARLDRVGPAKETAQLASVLGRDFSYALLSAVSSLPEPDLQSALARLADAELIHVRGRPPEATFQFKHALILDAAYGALLRGRRRALHDRVARTIKERFPALAQAQPEILARHWAEAGDIDSAVACWAEAARRAAARVAHAEAAAHLRDALAALRRKPADDARSRAELPLLTSLAISVSASVSYSAPEVDRVLAEARALSAALGDSDSLFSVLVNLCNTQTVMGDVESAAAAAHQCLEIASSSESPVQLIQGSFMVGFCLYSSGRLAEGRDHLERARSLCERMDWKTLRGFTPTNPLVECLSSLAFVYLALGERERAAEASDESLACGRALRPFDLAYALSFRGLWDGVVGAHADRLAHADELLQLCATHGIAAFQPTAALHKAFAIGRLEGPDMALALVQEATDRLRDLGIRLWMGPNLGDQASFKLLLGDVAGALLGVDEAIACATRSFQIILPRLHRLRAEILARTPGSDPADVQAALSLARAVTEAQGSMFFAQEAAQGVGGPLSWSLPICVVSRAAGDYSSMNSQSVSNSPKF